MVIGESADIKPEIVWKNKNPVKVFHTCWLVNGPYWGMLKYRPPTNSAKNVFCITFDLSNIGFLIVLR